MNKENLRYFLETLTSLVAAAVTFFAIGYALFRTVQLIAESF